MWIHCFCFRHVRIWCIMQRQQLRVGRHTAPTPHSIRNKTSHTGLKIAIQLQDHSHKLPYRRSLCKRRRMPTAPNGLVDGERLGLPLGVIHCTLVAGRCRISRLYNAPGLAVTVCSCDAAPSWLPRFFTSLPSHRNPHVITCLLHDLPVCGRVRARVFGAMTDMKARCSSQGIQTVRFQSFWRFDTFITDDSPKIAWVAVVIRRP